MTTHEYEVAAETGYLASPQFAIIKSHCRCGLTCLPLGFSYTGRKELQRASSRLAQSSQPCTAKPLMRLDDVPIHALKGGSLWYEQSMASSSRGTNWE